MADGRGKTIRLDSERVPLKILLACIGIEVGLYVLDIVFHLGGLIDSNHFRKLWKPTLESSFGSFWSIAQTVLSATTLWLIFALARRRGDARRVVAGWAVLAGFFTFMAADDGAKFHERMGSAIGPSLETSFPSYHWQVVFLPLFGAMGLFLLGFVWFQMNDRRSRTLIVVAISMLVGAVAIDFVEGLSQDHPWNIYERISAALGIDGWTRATFDRTGFKTVEHLFKSAEEVLFEAGANSLMWYLFLRRLLSMVDGERLETTPRPA